MKDRTVLIRFLAIIGCLLLGLSYHAPLVYAEILIIGAVMVLGSIVIRTFW